MMETQINISKSYKSFNFEDRLVKQIYSHFTSLPVTSDEELEEVLERITSDMFSTDRIYLDSYFSHEKSSQRYINWIRNEFDSKKSVLRKNFYDGENVGFALFKQTEDGTRHGLLGGVYKNYQNMGLGLMTACSSFISAQKENKPFKVMRTTISSNNVPMMQFYNYLNFKVDSMSYVFVKHNK